MVLRDLCAACFLSAGAGLMCAKPLPVVTCQVNLSALSWRDLMAVSPAHKYAVRAALMQFAKKGQFPFYSHCGFGPRGPGKDVLDRISREETRNGRPDITFVLRSRVTGYPSQIGFKPAKTPTDQQKTAARAEAQRIISAYGPAGARNPY